MEQVEDLFKAISDFKAGTPNERGPSLQFILKQPATELIYPAIIFILPNLTEEEKQIVRKTAGEEAFSEDFKPAAKLIPSLLLSGLMSENEETRDQATKLAIEFESKLDWKVKRIFLLLLSDPNESTREACANLLSEFKGEDARLFGHFVNAFFLGDMRAGRQLIREISNEEEAIPFIYLCLSKYKAEGTEKDNEFTLMLLSSLYNHSRDRWDFHNAEYKARQMFLRDQLAKGVRGEAFEKLKRDLDALPIQIISKADYELGRRSSIPPRPPERRNSSPPKQKATA